MSQTSEWTVTKLETDDGREMFASGELTEPEETGDGSVFYPVETIVVESNGPIGAVSEALDE